MEQSLICHFNSSFISRNLLPKWSPVQLTNQKPQLCFRMSCQSKMASLVANYSSGEDSDDDTGESEAVQSATAVETETEGRNYLIAQECDDSSDDETEKSSGKSEPERIKLPKPVLGKMKHGKPKVTNFVSKKLSDNSVFTNQYEKAAHAKQSILEKHVKMTEKLHNSDRKVCKKFKKGLCRFGNNCKFSHDLDANLSLPYQQQQNPDGGSQTGDQKQQKSWQHKSPGSSHPVPRQQGFMGTKQTLNSGPQSTYTPYQMAKFRQQEQHMQRAMEDDNDDDKFMSGDKRKKRVGVGQTLVPPKKAMTALDRQRQVERPWTVHQQ